MGTSRLESKDFTNPFAPIHMLSLLTQVEVLHPHVSRRCCIYILITLFSLQFLHVVCTTI